MVSSVLKVYSFIAFILYIQIYIWMACVKRFQQFYPLTSALLSRFPSSKFANFCYVSQETIIIYVQQFHVFTIESFCSGEAQIFSFSFSNIMSFEETIKPLFSSFATAIWVVLFRRSAKLKANVCRRLRLRAYPVSAS